MANPNPKCDGTWIEPYTRKDGKKVDGHCRMSVRTVLHDNQNNSRQLKRILTESAKSLKLIESKLEELKNPTSLADLRDQIDSLLKMSIPTTNTPSDLKELLKEHIRELKEHHARATSEIVSREDTHPEVVGLKEDIRKIQDQLTVIQEFMFKLDPLTKPSELSDKQIELDSLSTELSKAKKKSKHLKSKNEELDSKLRDANDTISSLEQRLGSLDQHLTSVVQVPIQVYEENKTLLFKNKDLEQDIRSLRLEITNVQSRQSQCEDTKQRLQVSVDEKARDIGIIQDLLREKESELARLKQSMSSTESNVSRLANEKDNLSRDLDRVKEKERDLTRELSNANEQVTRLQGELKTVKSTDKESRRIQDELSTLKSTNDRMKIELDTYKSEEKRLQDDIREKETTMSSMRLEIDNLKGHVSTIEKLEKDNTSHKEDLARLKQDLATMNQEKSNLMSQVSDLQSKLEQTTVNLTRELGQCTEKLKTLESEKSAIVSKESGLQSSNQYLQSEIVTLKQTIDELNTQLKNLRELNLKQTSLVEETQNQIVIQLKSEKEKLEKEISVLLKKHESELHAEREKCKSDITQLRDTMSSHEQTLTAKTVELEALQEKYNLLEGELRKLRDLKTEPNLETEQLQAQLKDTELLISQRVKELEQQSELDKKVIDQHRLILDEKDRELEQLRKNITETKRGLDTTQHAFNESLRLLKNATDILDQSVLYRGVSEQFKKNIEFLRSSKPIHLIEIKKDTILYNYAAPEPESYDEIYNEYEHVLTELKQVQTYYTKLVITVNAVNQQNESVQGDDKDSIVIYSFLTTALFHLTKTYLRLPSVLRIISMPTIELGSEENTKLRDSMLESLYVTNPIWFDKKHPLNRLLNDINSDLYLLFRQTIDKHQGSVRIDILAYYLMQFVYFIRDTKRTSTENNLFLRMIDTLSQTITTNLKLMMYTEIGDTKHKLSVLDTIQEQEYQGLRSEHNAFNKVITFVKIRVDGDVPNDINKRFECNILTKNDTDEIYKRTVLRVKYSDFDYRKNKEEDSLKLGNAEFATNGFRFYTENEAPACNLDLIKRNHDFYFGPFSQVYTADQSALDITNDRYFIEGVENKLRTGKPVCIIGYGSSGSGKTSTLVYLSYYKNGRHITQDGILAELSNKLSDTYNQSCRIQVYEFEGNISPGTDQDAISNYHVRKFPGPVALEGNAAGKPVHVYSSFSETKREHMDPNDSRGSCFEYVLGTIGDKKQWVKADTNRFTKIPITEAEYSSLSDNLRMIINGLYYKLVPDVDKSKGMVPMAQDIADFMDKKRNIAATANNPVSSRSHVVIFITYASSKSKTTLVLCDFAGVENRFDCDSESVLAKLASIPTKETADNILSEQTPFYQERISRIKISKFKQFIQRHGKELREQAQKVDAQLFKNVDYLLNKIQSEPLSNIESKKAEAQFQALYPPSQMVNFTTFFDRLKRVLVLKDIITKSPVNEMVIEGKSISTLFKEDYNEIILSAKTPLYKALKNVHGIDYSRLEDPITSRIIEMKPLMPIDRLNPSITNKLIWLSANYGKELFASYASDIERETSLLIWQYFFECMVNVPNPVYSDTIYPVTVDNVGSTFTRDICEERVKEGLYINDSLKVLRQFIGNLVQSSGYAPFVDECLSLQCNPFYKECFGINEYNPGVKTIQKGSLAEQIMKAPNSKDMTFCIMCVVNFSKKANNPPPSPYIDITELLTEYERLKAVEQQFFMKRRIAQKLITDRIGIDFDGALMSNAYAVNPKIINSLKTHPRLDRPLPESVQQTVKRYLDYLSKNNVHDDGNYLKTLSDLIDVLNNSNAITTIGTLQFTDTMAKFGSNSMTCNVAAGNSKIEATDAKAIINSITPAGAEEIYKGLKLLVTKGKLTRKEFLEQYKPFEGLYKPKK